MKMAEIKDISKDTFDSEVLSSDTLMLVYYYARWCKPCSETDALVEGAANEVDGQMGVVRVNTDEEAEIVAQQKIKTIPYFQILKDGKVLDSFRGVPSKLELMGSLSNAISEHCPEQTEEQTEEKKEG